MLPGYIVFENIVVHPFNVVVEVFLLEEFLLAKHQKNCQQGNEVVWNKIGMILRLLGIGFIAFASLCALCRRLYTLF